MPPYAQHTRRVLFAWGILWLLSFLTSLGGGAGLSTWLEMAPRAILDGKLSAMPGILTYALVHNPYSILHVAMNALIFFLVAPEVERLYRGRAFLRLLLWSALAGTVVTLLLVLFVSGLFAVPVVGGSGLVMTMVAITAAIYPDRRVNFILIQPRFIQVFLFLVLLDTLGFLSQLAGRDNGIATQVHLAGAAVGWWWADGFGRRGLASGGFLARWRSRRQARRASKAKRQAQDEEAELDRILAKIAREGMSSLDARERAFLERRSRK